MSRVFIIAEAGVNHNGDIALAKKLVDVAASAGADAVKFQTFITKNLVTQNAEKARYQKENTNNSESQYEMIKKLELSHENHEELISYCQEKEIVFLSSPFDLESIEYLISLNLPLLKIPSGELTNYPYLKKLAQYNHRLIVSTGMANLMEVNEALNVLRSHGQELDKVSLLHCTTMYPTPMNDVNLKAMSTLKNETNLKTGYSDHTEGVEVAVAAVALGAEIIEKHFTLDKEMEGPDHKASLNPAELTQMVFAIRNIEKALGSEEKKPAPSEIENISIARKSIVAKIDIKKGDRFTESNLTTKRPANGITPMKWNDLIGTVAKKDYQADEKI